MTPLLDHRTYEKQSREMTPERDRGRRMEILKVRLRTLSQEVCDTHVTKFYGELDHQPGGTAAQ